jgi:hypothetical protein
LGAAVRAFHGYLKTMGHPASWEALAEPHRHASLTVQPDMAAHAKYKEFAKAYAKAESEYVAGLG